MQLGPFDIPSGERSHSTEDSTDQDFNIDGDGNAIIYDSTYDNKIIKVSFRCDEDLAWNVRDFLVNGMRYRMRTFTFVDDFGVSHLVRYWEKTFSKTFVAPDLWEVNLVLRKEN